MIRSMSAVLSATSLLSVSLLTPEAKNKLATALMSASPDFDLQSFLKPDDRDYIHVPIRALSAAPVQGGILDFSYKGGLALKAAVPMFNQLTIFKDHNLTVDTWLGKTSGAYWDEATPGVPPGVNMMLDVDTKADPKTARGLISGALDSGSVTIKLNYEQSHPDMEPDEFMTRLGELCDGEVVRALVTEVVRCMEYSVVWQGADVFAKVISEDGKIHTPGRASNSLSHQRSQENNKMDWTKLALLLGLSLGENVTQESFEAAVKAQNINVSALAAAQVELTTVKTTLTATEAKLTAAETQVAELTTSVTKATADLAASAAQVTALTAKVADLTPKAELGAVLLTETRAEALRLYNLVEAGKATDALRSLIGNADLSVARSFVQSYKDRAEQIAPLKCCDCGSINLSRGTAQQNNDMPDGTTNAGKSKLESEQLKAALASLHGK